MTDLLDNPAVQAALIPFVVAFVLGLALSRTRFLAAAVASVVVVVLALTVGLSLDPLTSVKKLMLSVLVVSALGLALEAAAAPRRASIAALAASAGLAAVWVIVRVLQQMESIRPWAVGAAALAFVLVTVGSAMASGAASSLRGAVVGACLGWGSGVLALLGASALLAQIGLAVGTASAAVALVMMLRGSESPLGWTLVVPAAVASATIGVLACATGELRWYCLIPLPFASLAAWWAPVGTARPPWQRAFAIGAVAVLPVALAVGLAWWSGASPPAG